MNGSPVTMPIEQWEYWADLHQSARWRTARTAHWCADQRAGRCLSPGPADGPAIAAGDRYYDTGEPDTSAGYWSTLRLCEACAFREVSL